MKNKIIRSILCLLVAAMLLTCFAGCKKDNEGKESNESTVTTKGGDGIHDANGYLLDALPDELDYGGTDIRILGWQSEVTEFEAVDPDRMTIDESIYNRNASIEARLNVNLVFDLTVAGHNALKTEYAQHVERSISSDSPYDIIAAHTGSITTCAINGLMRDLGSLESSYLDFEKPWWNSDIIEQSRVGNTFFFCTGDASTSFAQMIYCVYFNVDMLNSLKLTSPYELVENNEWTYETMMMMCRNIYNDNNDSQTVDLQDTIPFIGQYYDWPALLEGCGIRFVEKDVSGAFKLTNEIRGEKSINVMEELANLVQLDGGYVGNDDDLTSHFKSGESLFYLVQSGAAARWSFAGTGFDYGCVPIPKFDADQTEYRCAVRKPISLFGMPIGSALERYEMLTAVLECYGSEGYRQTTPVIFEQVMKYQKSSSGQMTQMLVLIRDSACFDVGRLYSSHIGSLCDMPGYMLRDGTPWENYINQTMPQVENLLDKLSDTLISVAN